MSLAELYAYNSGARDWEGDVLGRKTIENGENFEINIDDGTSACRSGFRAVFENGRKNIKRNVNVCEKSKYKYTR